MSRAKRRPRGTLRGGATPGQDGGLSPSATTGAAGHARTASPDESRARATPGAIPGGGPIPPLSAQQHALPGRARPAPGPTVPARDPVHPPASPGPVLAPPSAGPVPASADAGRAVRPPAAGRGPAPSGGRPRPSRRFPGTGGRTIRLRLAEADPWSVMVTSFLLLAGLGALVIATAGVVWILMQAMAPDVLPTLSTVLVIAFGVVTLEVILGTGLVTLGAFLYNLSAQFGGGVEIAVTEALTGPTPAAARVLLYLARLRVRARRCLRTYTRSSRDRT